ncbi:MAG TPA: hemolysin family protein [Candidatus Eisenbacteria bacterium]|nr:hemolysin family protein [Candidatus Eisenbacteria bacterium]
MSIAVIFVILLLVGLLTLVSYVDRVYQEAGRFLSREFQDNIDVFEQKIEPALRIGRSRASLSMAVLTQLTIASIAMLIGFLVFHDSDWNIYDVLQAVIGLLLIVIVCNRFLPFVFFSRTKGEWLMPWVLLLKGLIYLVMPLTLAVGFLQSVVTLTRQNTSEEPETAAEAVDALIEAGQEEGIIQEGDRDLIQSVVEFSGKTVREAMKPRPVMFALPASTSVEQFIEMLRAKHYSRVPVYEGNIHNIKGIVYTADVLQVPDTEAHVRTLDSIMRRDVYFVPESKLGSDLLREMQKQNIRMAIVVDEYGGVAGLVTIEDLVEEIVGEIRDERDKPEIMRDGDRGFIVSGGMDVDRLGELFGTKPEGKESATIAGLVSELAGRIPRKGESVEDDGLRFEVLESTDRKIERVRVSALPPQQLNLIETASGPRLSASGKTGTSDSGRR